MKVVFVNRYYWPDESATAQMLTALAVELARDEGMEVVILTSRQLYQDAKAELASEETHLGVQIRRLSSTAFGREKLALRLIDYMSFYLSVTLAMTREGKDADWLVVKTDPPLLSIPALLAKLLTGVRTVAWCQDVFPEIAFARKRSFPWTILAGALSRLRDLSLNHADRVVAIGEDMRRFINGRIREQSRTHVLHNFVADEAVRPIDAMTNPLRRKWQLEEAFVLAYSGNLGRMHEYQTVLDAARQLSDLPQFRLLFIGSGALQDNLVKSLEPALAGRVNFQPYQPKEHLAESLSVADVHWLALCPEYQQFALPSKLYGILAAGRPCIYIGDPKSHLAQELVAEGVGYCVAPGNSNELARVLRAWIDDPRLLTEMGSKARALAINRYAFHKTVHGWRQMLQILDKTG